MSLSDMAGVNSTPPKDAEPKSTAPVAENSTPAVTPPAAPQTTVTATPSPSTTSPEPTPTTTNQTSVLAPSSAPVNEVLAAVMGVIAPVGADESKSPLKMLLYSLPGAGKTTLIGQIPDSLVIDTEEGRTTLTENKKHRPDLIADNSNVYTYKSFEGLELIIKTLQGDPPELAHIKTIVIDTMNNLHKRGLAEITDKNWQRNPGISRYKAETDDHTENNEHIRRLAQAVIDTGRNVVFVCHSKTVEPKNQPSRTYPDFSEKLANTLCGMVDVVGYMYETVLDEEPARVIKFRGNENYVAKKRYHALPENLVNPKWDDIWAAYNA